MDTTKAITHVSLCAGYGGIDIGLSRAIPSLRTVAFSEIEAFACANLVSKMEAGLLDAAPIWTNLKTFPWDEFLGKVDILSGGFPCQPFSSAGKRDGDEDPRHLFPYILDGIRRCQPSVIFLENVEGILSSKLTGDNWEDQAGTPVLLHILRELERVGYKATAGIFSAREVGAPHQRKRLFILAYSDGKRGQLSDWWRESAEQMPVSNGEERRAWPSRPGEPQHGWEPPRVVGNSEGWSNGQQPTEQQGRNTSGRSGEESGAMGNAHSPRPQERTGQRGAGIQGTYADGGAHAERQTQPSLGLHFNESTYLLGKTLTLNPYGDSVIAYENISNKINAREVLFNVWRDAISQEIQWTTRGLQCLLAEKVLQSGMQLDSFTQRICYFIWCIQTSHKTQGWGLHGMWVYETFGDSSQRQKPIEQFQRELGYAMCQLSYEIALARGQDYMEGKSILQGVREASERAWTLSEALPEMEEVWRSSLNQAVWENGCYVEATSIGNRTDELRLLGNGVVPATAERAFRTLLAELIP